MKTIARDSPIEDDDRPSELKVTVEQDLVSQAEEDDMEALLGTYVLVLMKQRHFLNV